MKRLHQLQHHFSLVSYRNSTGLLHVLILDLESVRLDDGGAGLCSRFDSQLLLYVLNRFVLYNLYLFFIRHIGKLQLLKRFRQLVHGNTFTCEVWHSCIFRFLLKVLLYLQGIQVGIVENGTGALIFGPSFDLLLDNCFGSPTFPLVFFLEYLQTLVELDHLDVVFKVV